MPRPWPVLVAFAVVGCGAPARPPTQPPIAIPPPEGPPTVEIRPPEPPAEPPPHITWARAETAADVPAAPPDPGTFRVHLIDVGTGLSILIQGHDFAMLFDAGTNDRVEKPARVVAYLGAALGPSGAGALCGDPPAGARRALDHVVLSHPHLDHGSALDTVLHCYDVGQFWDAGRVNDTVFYRDLLEAVAREPDLVYHTAASVPDDHQVTVRGAPIAIPRWERFSEGDVIALGARARFTILHAEPKAVADINENSIVLLVELGGARLLLVGDAPSGARLDPAEPPGEVEAFLLDHHAAELRADILQVGHHGSKTSSRRAFLTAIAPALALVSSGPKVYGATVLPDREVLDELERLHATVLRTDERDAACPVRGRLGGDTGPGGCDAWIVTIAPR